MKNLKNLRTKSIASGNIRRKRQIYKLINTVVSPLNGVVSSVISVVSSLNTDNREIDAVKKGFVGKKKVVYMNVFIVFEE